MSVLVNASGPMRVGSGTVFIASTGVPYGAVEWRLTGAGILTPLQPRADAGGVATARWDAGAATPGDPVLVEVDVYP